MSLLKTYLLISGCLTFGLRAQLLSTKNAMLGRFHVQTATLENVRGLDGKAAYENQDRIVCQEVSQNRLLVGVFDGHGKKGDTIATWVQGQIPQFFNHSIITKPAAFMEQINTRLQAELEKDSNAQKSGTTAAFALIDGQKAFISNTGDSRVIFKNLAGTIISTSDHKPSDQAERARIIKAGGFVNRRGYVCVPGVDYCLALSRSLGDVVAHTGNVVSLMPDVYKGVLEPGDYLLFGTDGLFDVFSNNEVIAFVEQEGAAGNKTTIAQKLAEEARKRGSRDDISIVVVFAASDKE